MADIERSIRLTDDEQDMLITILWDRIKSKDFKEYLLRTYVMEKMDLRQFIDLIYMNSQKFNLKIFKFTRSEYR